ncbi:metal-sensitive transcriptional regulator [Microaerobacter geothermalis]|uniref:metal-sensitive transcriptional regulator n=1 Tax=Microaerobacter geothermalis TaxID=674972 RepID=UPI001F2DD535|nr:metal-sensitive transcriptional regulator [Microaerobacter geothermalis]MCF6095215.1 metal-sensitive transcriptional regulator [Microaerobacter geothermalis]
MQDSSYDAKVINRLRRIEGQVRGVIKMMEEKKTCRDVVTQMTAIRSAMDKAILQVVADNLNHCISEQISKGEPTEEVVEDAIQILLKSR